MELLYDYINISAAYSLIISILLVLKDRKLIRNAWVIIGFLICIVLYITIDYINSNFIKYIVISGPFLLPFMFWWFARSLFRDNMSHRRILIYLAPTLATYYLFYLLETIGQATYTSILTRAFSIFFVILAIIESQSNKSKDLDESRIRFRRYFVSSIAVVVLLTLLVEIGLREENHQYPRFLQRTTILIINSYFIISSFSIKSILLSKAKSKSKPKYSKLAQRVQEVMNHQSLHRQEKLTIGQLSEILHEQEYIVRRAINQNLGYRNFLDFVNSYRLKEASDMLKNPDLLNLSILEIAYKSGFNSIGPFNRAFKATTGLTPTDFRKKHHNNFY